MALPWAKKTGPRAASRLASNASGLGLEPVLGGPLRRTPGIMKITENALLQLISRYVICIIECELSKVKPHIPHIEHQ